MSQILMRIGLECMDMTARIMSIKNIPAVIAIKGGQVAGQQIGLVSKDDMKGFIEGVF